MTTKNEVKGKVHEAAASGASKAAEAAKAASGWKKWLLIALAVLLAGVAVFTQTQCTITQARQAAELHDIYHYVTDTECQLAQPEKWITILPVEESKK